MSTPPVEARLNVLEYDMQQLKLRLARLEGEWRRQAGPGETPAPEPAPVRSPIPAVAIAPPQPRESVVREPITSSGPLPPPLPMKQDPEAFKPAPAPAHEPAPPPASVNLAEAAGKVVEPEFSPEPEPRNEGPSFTDRLRALGVLPPDDANREVALGAWWTTRIGAVLGALTAVFLAVYVSFNTPPWVRWLELLAVALGVTAVGLRLDRTLVRVGRVVLGLGLSLVYFTCVAGYALGPVRVFLSTGSAAVAQAVAIGAMLGVSLWKRSQSLALIAITLGTGASLWARTLETPHLGWVAMSALVAVSLMLRVLRSWNAPALVALPAGYAMLAMDSLRLGSPFVVYGSLGTLWLLAWVTDFRAARRGEGGGWLPRILLALNGGAASLTGFACLVPLDLEAHLDLYLAVAGGLILCAAAAHRFLVEDRRGFAPLQLKGATLLVLAAIAWFDGPGVWFALLAQATLWLAASRRDNSRWMEVCAVVIAIVAAVSFGLRDVEAFPAYFGAFWLVAASLWAWWWAEQRSGEIQPGAGEIGALPSAAATLITLCAIHWWVVEFRIVELAPVACAALTVSALLAVALRSRVQLLLALVFWAAGVGCIVVGGDFAGMHAPACAAFLIVVTVAAALRASARLPHPAVLPVAGAFAGLVAAFTLADLWPAAAFAATAVAGCVLLVPLGVPVAVRRLMEGAALGLLAFHLPATLMHAGSVPSALPGWPIASMGLLALVLPGWLVRRGRSEDPWSLSGPNFSWEPVWGALATAAFLLFAYRLDTTGAHLRILVAPAAALLFALLGARWRVLGARATALTLAGLAVIGYLSWLGGEPPKDLAVGYGVSIAALTLGLGAFSRRWAPLSQPGFHPALLKITAGVGAALAAIAVYQLPGAAHRHVTATWGLVGILLFVGGLLGRWKPWRLAGLALLAVATLRLFVIDMSSTLTRIFAFGALAVVLLVVGYLYQKFRDRIGGDEPPAN